MIRPYPLRKLIGETEFVPQAILALDVDELARRFGSRIEVGQDDFDEHEGVAGVLETDGTAFALMHYKGHPRKRPRSICPSQCVTPT